jgi:hypothetical protein
VKGSLKKEPAAMAGNFFSNSNFEKIFDRDLFFFFI